MFNLYIVFFLSHWQKGNLWNRNKKLGKVKMMGHCSWLYRIYYSLLSQDSVPKNMYQEHSNSIFSIIPNQISMKNGETEFRISAKFPSVSGISKGFLARLHSYSSLNYMEIKQNQNLQIVFPLCCEVSPIVSPFSRRLSVIIR